LADASSDAELATLHEQAPSGGSIEVAFRYPHGFFHALRLKGEAHQVMVVHDGKSGRIVGMGTRSVKRMHINGIPQPFGYLSDLRIAAAHRRGTVLARGYRFLHQLHGDRPVPAYVTTVVEGNHPAENALIGGRGNLPLYHDFGRYSTFVIPVGRGGRSRKGATAVKVVRGDSGQVPEILACLARNGRTRQFYPEYTADNLFGAERFGLVPEDFFLILAQGRAIGVAAWWNVQRFRQVVVRAYHGTLSWLRPGFNLLARLHGSVPLPRPGQPLNCFFVGAIAVDGDDPSILTALLEGILADPRARAHHYLAVGLHERDPLLPAVATFRHHRFDCRIHVVGWPEDEAWIARVDGRIPYLEVATL
jgi:hypothetical protein